MKFLNEGENNEGRKKQIESRERFELDNHPKKSRPSIK
jgi:hypothetical protein